jgi:hypothetical protein
MSVIDLMASIFNGSARSDSCTWAPSAEPVEPESPAVQTVRAGPDKPSSPYSEQVQAPSLTWALARGGRPIRRWAWRTATAVAASTRGLEPGSNHGAHGADQGGKDDSESGDDSDCLGLGELNLDNQRASPGIRVSRSDRTRVREGEARAECSSRFRQSVGSRRVSSRRAARSRRGEVAGLAPGGRRVALGPPTSG